MSSAGCAAQARRAAEEAELQEQNRELAERIQNTKAVVDDDITDEPAGAERGKPVQKGWTWGWGKDYS